MSEQKIWVEKMPKICNDCPCCNYGDDGEKDYTCNLMKYGYDALTDDNLINKKPENCPLHSIKDHDRELVEKIIKEVEDSFTKYLPLRNRSGAWFYGRLNEILKKYQKEFEDEN